MLRMQIPTLNNDSLYRLATSRANDFMREIKPLARKGVDLLLISGFTTETPVELIVSRQYQLTT